MKMSEALDSAGRIGTILNNAGSQGSGTIAGDADWVITTIEQMRVVQQIERINNDQPLYHMGHMFSITMEKI